MLIASALLCARPWRPGCTWSRKPYAGRGVQAEIVLKLGEIASEVRLVSIYHATHWPLRPATRLLSSVVIILLGITLLLLVNRRVLVTWRKISWVCQWMPFAIQYVGWRSSWGLRTPSSLSAWHAACTTRNSFYFSAICEFKLQGGRARDWQKHEKITLHPSRIYKVCTKCTITHAMSTCQLDPDTRCIYMDWYLTAQSTLICLYSHETLRLNFLQHNSTTRTNRITIYRWNWRCISLSS